jgi:hypothetical protein
LKVLILKGDEDYIWVHIDRIQRIHVHKFRTHTEITIHTIDKFRIIIHDHHIDVFMPMLDDFIKSDKEVKILKMPDLRTEDDYAFMRTNDWISNVVEG